MELCVLKFDGDTLAATALDAALVTRSDRPDWVDDVSVVSRSRFGRLTVASAASVGASWRFRYEEGELVKRVEDLEVYGDTLLGPLDAVALDVSRMGAVLAGDIERRFFHVNALKELLWCDSSALLLFAGAAICEDVHRTLSAFRHEVIRRGLDDDLARRFTPFDARPGDRSRTTKASVLH
jgi:hypothetical protein